MMAGNCTPLTAGASVALPATEQWVAAHALTPFAYWVDAEIAAVNYVSGSDCLLMTPTYAVPWLLARDGLGVQAFDFYEIHEGLASVVLAHLQARESEESCRAGWASMSRLGRSIGLSSMSTVHHWLLVIPLLPPADVYLCRPPNNLPSRKQHKEKGGRAVAGFGFDLCCRRSGCSCDSRGLRQVTSFPLTIRRDRAVP